MMEQEVKATPGPWGEHPYSSPEWQHVGAGENHGPFKAASLSIGAGHKLLGRVEAQSPVDGEFGFPQVDSLEEMRANFALICAAPDMLAALNSALGHLLNAKIDLETGCPKATAIRTIDGGLKAVRAAIALAEPRA